MVATPTNSIGFQNFYSSTTSADITATSTDIFLNTVPSVSESFLVMDPDSVANREIIYYNSKTATKVTCPSVADGRGQGGTTAVAHLTGTTVIMAPIAEYFSTLLSLFTTSPQGWTSGSGTITAVTANGNRSYTATTSADLRATLSNGMRFRTTNTVAGPTQSTSLNGTTQFWSKTTPAGMTFTDDFVAGAWIKLSAYPSVEGAIISRYNGTSGWSLKIASTGQVYLTGLNAAAANYSQVGSYQSVPLNKWVHITAQLDMSTFTATSTTSYIMIDGVDVPAAVTRGGTNPTALVQAGNLEIGSQNGGAQLTTGKIASAFVTSAKVTQANVRTLMSQTITSSLISTNSIISAYSFDGNANDLNTTNANNLTANGSATATNADSYSGVQADGTVSSTLNYGIVTNVTNTTVTFQVPEGNTIPTTGGITSFSYSTYKAPYGMPIEEGKWYVETDLRARQSGAGGAAQAFINLNQYLTVPIGAWDLGYATYGIVTHAGATFLGHYVTLSTANNTQSDNYFTSASSQINASLTEQHGHHTKSRPVTVTAPTTYYLNIAPSQTGTTLYLGDTAVVVSGFIRAKLAYL